MFYLGDQIKYKDWRIPISIHRPPKEGWGATNELSKAWVNSVAAVDFFNRFEISKNRTIMERRRKDGSVKKTEMGKNDIHLWSPVRWDHPLVGARSEAKVKTVNALVLDLDGIKNKDKILSRLSAFCYNAHSTFSNGSSLKRGYCFRIVLPLSRPVPKEEWPVFWREAVRLLCPECDPAAKDPARLWFVRSCRDDRKGSMWNLHQDGHCIDVDAIIKQQPQQQPQQQKKESIPIPLPPPTQQTDEQEGGRFKVRWVDPLRVMVQIKERGKQYSLKEIIDDWEGFVRDFRGNKRGYLNCICPFAGTTVGSAFIKREENMLSSYPVWTLTSNATRMHFRSIASKHGVILDKKTQLPVIDRGNATRHVAANYPDLWLDMRTGVPYMGTNKLHDYEIDNLGVEVTYSLQPGAAAIGNKVFLRAFYGAAALNQRDPLKEKLLALPKWTPDGVHRIEEFFIKWLKVEDTQLNRVYSKKFFIGALARALDWGCRLDSVLIIKGEQGIQKSKLWEALSMGCFVDEKIDITDKDGKAKLRHGWIVEMAELANLKGKMIEDIRHFITLKSDMYREVWGYKQEYHPRRCALVRSTNEDSFNLDAKGSRRLWIMESKAQEYADTYDEEKLRDVVPLLWAEAMYYYNKGRHVRDDGTIRYDKHLYWLNQDEFKMSKERNGDFKPQDMHEQLVHEWLVGKQGEEITVLDVIKSCYDPERTRLKPRSWSGHIPQILAAYGCTSTRKQIYGKKRTVYTVPKTDEILKQKQLNIERRLRDKKNMKEYWSQV